MRAHLASLVEDFRLHASETAVVAHRGNRRFRTTYGELATLAGRFAAELDRRGVLPGDRVVLWGTNSAEWMAVFFGCLMRGLIAVPLDATGTPEFAAQVIRDVSPKLILSDPDLQQKLPSDTAVPYLSFANLPAQLPPHADFTISPAVTSETPFQIIFTSGTTSEPKGIVHTHANVLSSVSPIEQEMKKYRRYERWFHPLRFLHTLPLSHVFGQFMGLWLPPLLAAEVHFADQIEARRMVDLIRTERVSVLVAVPRILELLRAHLLARFETLGAEITANVKMPILKRMWHFRRVHRTLGWKFWAVISGGATLPSELEEFWNRVGIALIQGYGMTETTALVTLNHPFKIARGTIGKILPGREVKLSEDGEILVRGPMLSAATWTGGAIRPRQQDWLPTGDLASRNDRGEMHFLGRKDDVIVTSAGLNVFPADLEAAMKRRPEIRDCVVVPCSTARGTEPVAVVLTSKDSVTAEAGIDDAVSIANTELAEYQQIRRVLRWPEPRFPYTSTGKLLRRKVAVWACQAVHQQSAAGSDRANGFDLALHSIETVTGEGATGDSDDLRLIEDLRLDSLGRVQLQTVLEQALSVELPDNTLDNVKTLGELRLLIGKWSVPSLIGEPSTAIPRSDEQKEVIPGHIYPKWPWAWPVAALRVAFIEVIMRPLIWILAAPEVTSQLDELPESPLLIIANHLTAYDGALILFALPGRLRRHTAIAMSGEMLSDLRHGRNQGGFLQNLFGPPQYWLLTALFNVFPLPRIAGFRSSFAHAGHAMDNGYSVMVFPEGARSQNGQMQPFRQGIGLLAAESRIPVLPVALVGLQQMRRSGWFRSGLLQIRIGSIIPITETQEASQIAIQLERAVGRMVE